MAVKPAAIVALCWGMLLAYGPFDWTRAGERCLSNKHGPDKIEEILSLAQRENSPC